MVVEDLLRTARNGLVDPAATAIVFPRCSSDVNLARQYLVPRQATATLLEGDGK